MSFSSFFFLLFTILLIEAAVILEPGSENALNFQTNWNVDSKECNVYDETHYCQQLVIDQRLTLVAVSTKCQCPTGYRCPNDTSDTRMTTMCDYDYTHHWNKCKLRCSPIDV